MVVLHGGGGVEDGERRVHLGLEGVVGAAVVQVVAQARHQQAKDLKQGMKVTPWQFGSCGWISLAKIFKNTLGRKFEPWLGKFLELARIYHKLSPHETNCHGVGLFKQILTFSIERWEVVGMTRLKCDVLAKLPVTKEAFDCALPIRH